MQLSNEIMKGLKSDKGEKMNLLDQQYQGLNMQEMTPLPPSSTEYTEIKDYLIKSAGSTHHTIKYKIQV